MSPTHRVCSREKREREREREKVEESERADKVFFLGPGNLLLIANLLLFNTFISQSSESEKQRKKEKTNRNILSMFLF